MPDGVVLPQQPKSDFSYCSILTNVILGLETMVGNFLERYSHQTVLVSDHGVTRLRFEECGNCTS